MGNTAKQKDAVSAKNHKLGNDLAEWKEDIVVLAILPTFRKKVRAQRFTTLSSTTLSSNVHDIMDNNNLDENGNMFYACTPYNFPSKCNRYQETSFITHALAYKSGGLIITWHNKIFQEII